MNTNKVYKPNEMAFKHINCVRRLEDKPEFPEGTLFSIKIDKEYIGPLAVEAVRLFKKDEEITKVNSIYFNWNFELVEEE